MGLQYDYSRLLTILAAASHRVLQISGKKALFVFHPVDTLNTNFNEHFNPGTCRFLLGEGVRVEMFINIGV